MNTTTPLVINWHVNEACNYSCQYCYAAWKPSTSKRELINSPERTSALLKELYSFFQPKNNDNPLSKQTSWDSVRLNFAGGEPLLHSRRIPSVIDQARTLGFEVSMITNGSYLDDNLLEQLAPQLSWLGISIDSALLEQNRSIGRVDSRGRLLDTKQLALRLSQARQSNPGLRIKLNTVVNRLNHSEDLSALLHSFNPQKWKVLRMLPVVNQLLAVSDDQFAAFVARHHELNHILCAEDNQDMRDSYLMIDPHGRFFQNSSLVAGQGYAYSQPILEAGAQAAFSTMRFDYKRFSARYIPVPNAPLVN